MASGGRQSPDFYAVHLVDRIHVVDQGIQIPARQKINLVGDSDA